MRSLNKYVLFSLLLFFNFNISYSQNNSTTYIVTNQTVSKEPINPLLYGNFIELGYGRQVEGMWAQMFFNRSFEYFYPYRWINKAWFDLFYDEAHSEKGYEKDWSKFDWYHSGYEHNEWYAAPGIPDKPSVITDSSTFFKRTTPERKVILSTIKGGSGHGIQCLKVENEESDRWGAVAQSGKLFIKGEKYNFSGMIKSDVNSIRGEIRIYPQGKWDKAVKTIPIEIKSGDFKRISVTIDNPNFSGYITFSLWIPPMSSIEIDDFSLMPTDTFYGWRKDVVETLKKINPKIIRFPGGCFASFYNWRDGIGFASERIPKPSYFWGGLNYNDVGTAEYAMLCKAVGAQMQMNVNVYHPSKRQYDVDFPHWQDPFPGGFEFPEFMSLTKGAQSAADWVAYCNSKVGENKMADLRAKHGYVEPFGVKYWELDNEVHRWFEAKDYAWAVVIYSKAMKAVDPSIKIGMSSYGGRPDEKDYHQSFEEMLDIAGPYIDFIADRGDGETISGMMLDKVRAYNKSHGTRIIYCDTEWLAYNTDEKRDVYNMSSKGGGVTKSYSFSKWYYALNLARNFMAFQRLGDDVGFVNFNNLANTHSQCAMDTPKEGAFLTASGKVLELMSRSPAAYILKINNYRPKEQDEFQVQAAWNMDKKKLVLYICNRTGEKYEPSFDLSLLNKNFEKGEMYILSAQSPLSMNTSQNHDAIKQTDKKVRVKNIKHLVKFESKPFSFTQIILQ